MTVTPLERHFLQDAEELLTGIRVSIQRLGQGDVGHVEEAFRSAHSIKSEAAFLGIEDVVVIAEEIEAKLEPIRADNRLPGAVELDYLRTSADRLAKSIAGVEQSLMNNAPSANRHKFDSFELDLIREARKRDERLYCAGFSVDSESVMPYAKAYLAISNLELAVNVIKTEPDLSSAVDSIPETVRVYCTTDRPPEVIQSALDVDEIERITVDVIENVDVNSEAHRVGSNGPGETDLLATEDMQKPSHVRLSSYAIEELHTYARDLARMLNTGDVSSPGLYAARSLSNVLYHSIRELRLMKMGEFYAHLPPLVEESSRQLGKDVTLNTLGEEIEIDRSILDILFSAVTHLIRNSLAHGIEDARDRVRLGKQAHGTITLSAHMSGSNFVLSIADDGRGIREEEVRAKAKAEGIPWTSLFDVIKRSGFTLKSVADTASGRGVGLDAVAKIVEGVAGGSVSLSSEEGVGTEVVLTVPCRAAIIKAVEVAAGGKRFYIPRHHIRSMNGLNGKRWSTGPDGGVLCNGLKVFTTTGAVKNPRTISDSTVAVELSYAGHRFALIVDDVLIEREFRDISLESEADFPLDSESMTVSLHGAITRNVADAISGEVRSFIDFSGFVR